MYPNYSAVSGEKLIFKQSWWGDWKNHEDAVNPSPTAGLQEKSKHRRNKWNAGEPNASSSGWYEGIQYEDQASTSLQARGEKGQTSRSRLEWKNR